MTNDRVWLWVAIAACGAASGYWPVLLAAGLRAAWLANRDVPEQ